MKLNQNKWRLLIVSLVTLGVCIYLIKPIYLTKPLKLGLICKVCTSPEANQLIALKLAGDSIVTLARIVGLPNQQIQIQNGRIEVDQQISNIPVPKDFSYDPKNNTTSEFFVLIYDRNLEKVIDFGRVNQSRLIGKVFFLW